MAKDVKTYLKSDYYTLEDVHDYNTFVKSLPEPNLYVGHPKMDSILKLLECPPSYESLEEFVPKSEKWLEIKNKKDAYADAQEILKTLNFSSKVVIDEYNIGFRDVRQYQFQTKEMERGYDGEDDYEVTVNWIFYGSSSGYKIEVLVPRKDLIASHIRKRGRYETKDFDLVAHIVEKCRSHETRLLVYEFCDAIGVFPSSFDKVFRIESVVLYSGSISRFDYFLYNGGEEKIYPSQVKKLIEEYEVAKYLTYIKDDKYVKYGDVARYYYDFVKEAKYKAKE